MKVAFLAQHLKASGGAERVLSVFANELSSREGFEVSVVLMFPQGSEYRLDSRVRKVYLYNDDSQYAASSPFDRILKIRYALKELKTDYAIPFLWFICLYTFAATVGTNTKLIQTVRNNPALVPGSSVMRAVRLATMRFSHGCFVQNTAQLEYFPKSLRDKMVVIPNPISDEFLELEVDPTVSNTVVMVGRLVEQKNHIMMLKAVSLLRDQGRIVKVLIYGDGDLRQDISNEIKQAGLSDICKLMGSTEDVPSVFSKAGVYVLTSRYEGQPNSLLEAMASGLPCISTDCPTGPSDFISDGENGYLVSIDDVPTLAERVGELLASPSLRSRLGINAKKSILNACSPKMLTDRLIDAFIH